MKRIQTLIQSLLLVSALTFSGSALAGFNFGGDSCADGSGMFSQAIPHNETAEVGVIPMGKTYTDRKEAEGAGHNRPKSTGVGSFHPASGTQDDSFGYGLFNP
jgi:hypothetical protein